MEELALFCRLALSTVFLSAGFSKIGKWEHHRIIVEEYQIMPIRWVPLLVRVEVWLEVLVGFLLLLGVSMGAWLGSVLLVAYTVAIGINLLRGRNTISCGCGGVVGDHQLSWKLVLRNLGLLAANLYGLQYIREFGSVEAWWHTGDSTVLLNSGVWMTVLASCATILTWMLASDLVLLRRRIRALLKD
jgi:uncharacterized membrane protein YphA (DoxX/SURF4 family)